MRKFRSIALALSLCAAPAALAQDEKKEGEQPVRQDPPAAEPEKSSALDPAELLAKLAALYPKTLKRPTLEDAKAASTPEQPVPLANLETAWRATIKDLAKGGDEYMAALNGAAPDARAHFYRGAGHAKLTELDTSSQIKFHSGIVVESMEAYLGATDEKAEFRADAERWAGRALLYLGRVDEGVAHLGKAVRLLQSQGRHDDAGEAAYDALVVLQSAGRTSDLAALADSIDAAKADFGGSTPSIRKFANAAKLAVGAPLPALPKTKDSEGQEVSWAPGRPLLIHFFQAGYLGGLPSTTREIELEIRPLAEAYKAKGLAIVGISMDYAVPEGKAEEMRKNWDEWGRKEKFSDGSLATVREYAVKQGVDWPWIWDGKAVNNPLSIALGGVGVSSPYAVLVDSAGVVQWMGGAPFRGLPEAVAKLVK